MVVVVGVAVTAAVGAGGDLFADVTSVKNQLNSVQNEGFHNLKNGSHQESSCQAPGAQAPGT